MSWFSDFFRNLFGKQQQSTPPSYAPPQSTQMPQRPWSIPTSPAVQPIPTNPATTGATTMTTTTDPAAPWGYTVGPNGKVANTGPDQGWGWDGYGTPFTSQADADRYNNLTTTVTTDQAATYHGPVPVSTLTDDDKCYLMYCIRNYQMPNAPQLFYGVCSGPKEEIDLAMQFADTHYGNFNITTYDQSKLGGYVDAYSKGMLVPVYS